MPLGRPHILYIEDHEDTRDLVTFILNQKNYEVTTASTVTLGVDLAQQKSFDLYLLDSRLPDGSGVDLCRKLRTFDTGTPILFYSAAAYEVDRQTALESGAQGYLIKPSADGELCSLIATLINGKPNH